MREVDPLSIILINFDIPALILFCTTYIVSTWIHRKHIRCPALDICEPHRKYVLQYLFYCCLCVFQALPKNRYPIVLHVCFCGTVFSDPLTSNGHMYHNIYLTVYLSMLDLVVLHSLIVALVLSVISK
jgi:hypothetical protein